MRIVFFIFFCYINFIFVIVPQTGVWFMTANMIGKMSPLSANTSWRWKTMNGGIPNQWKLYRKLANIVSTWKVLRPISLQHSEHSQTNFDHYWRPTTAALNSVATTDNEQRNSNIRVIELYGNVEFNRLLCVYSTRAIAKGSWIIGPESLDGYGSGPNYDRPTEHQQ